MTRQEAAAELVERLSCANCDGYDICKAKEIYEPKGEVCYWYISSKIRGIPDKQFIREIRKVLYSNEHEEFICDKLREMFERRERIEGD